MFVAESGSDMIVRLQTGEDFFECLNSLNLTAGVLVGGIGMLRDVTLAFWTGKEYIEHVSEGPVELLSLQGNFSLKDGKTHVHCHAVLGLEDGKVIGGHLSKATVNETNEIYIHKLSGIQMERRKEASGLFGLYPSRQN